MSLLSGLEKFGFSDDEDIDIFEEEKKKKTTKRKEPKQVKDPILLEKDLLLDRKMECPVCGLELSFKSVRNTKLKRIEPDFDLRPNFENIDTLKYDIISCNHCGYTAMTRSFDHVTPGQRKMLKESVQAKFKPIVYPDMDTYTYNFAIERYKLALVTAMARKAKLSEKAYICLKTAWLLRSAIKEFGQPTDGANKAQLQELKNEYEAFYRKAYDGLLKSVETETPPYCGMDTATVEFILANMSMYYKEYDVASKLVSRLLTTPGTPNRIKDKCLDMKDEILKAVKKK